MLRKIAYLGVIALLISSVISCEKDFTDLGTKVIDNNQFSVGETVLEVEVKNLPISEVRADGIGIGGVLGQYLLGVYDNPNFEKIEGSVVSQLLISTLTKLVNKEYGEDTTVVTTLDAAYVKLAYHATLNENTSSGPDYSLDSVFGNTSKPFTLNVYRSDTYLNSLNPSEPTQQNSYLSTQQYEKLGEALNETLDLQFLADKNDTVLYIPRKLSNGSVYKTDTVKYFSSSTSKTPVPVAKIHLRKDKVKELLLDKYQTSDFGSQDAFDNYFRGLILEAKGDDSNIISFNFNPKTVALRPSIEVYFTNTILKNGAVIDTISRQESFQFTGIRNSIYKMTNKTYPAGKNVIVQGTAGSMAEVKILQGNQLQDLRSENLLINDASLTFYIDQESDTTEIPYRLYLTKRNPNNGNPIDTQVLDAMTEGVDLFGGKLQKENDLPSKYNFRITDYVSEMLKGNISENYPLRVRVYNPTDPPADRSLIDTIVSSHNWNPKAITLLNGDATNGTRRAQLKISYSKKK